jgi:hypothetical protein
MKVVQKLQFGMFVLVVLLGCVCTSVPLFAQAAEIRPYGGFYWPGNNNQVGEFKNNQLLGVRGGFYVTKGFEIGGNWGWSNHFQPSDSNAAAAFAGILGFPQGKVRANIWEAEFSYNFGSQAWFGTAIKPYVVGGIGGLTANIKDGDDFVLNTRSVPTAFGPVFFPNDTLHSGDTFLTFSYGGGVKAERVWGAMGFFGDFRGRTIPNFFSGHGTNWPEVSAGLSFVFGEK